MILKLTLAGATEEIEDEYYEIMDFLADRIDCGVPVDVVGAALFQIVTEWAEEEGERQTIH